MSVKHCATCRCRSTFTGQAEAFINSHEPVAQVTTAQVAEAIGHSGDYLEMILDKLAREGEIRRVRPGVYAPSAGEIGRDMENVR